MNSAYTWHPSDKIIATSNIGKMMLKHDFEQYKDFWKWSVEQKESFWKETVEALGIQMKRQYDKILDIEEGVENAKWLSGGKLNIVDSCFQNAENAIAVIYQEEGGEIQTVTQKALASLVNRIANGLVEKGFKKGDSVAIDMPMTLEAVAIYLACIKAGIIVVTIADSFASHEIAVRLDITKPKLVFTQDVILRSGKVLPLYHKFNEIKEVHCVVIPVGEAISLKRNDIFWNDFLSDNTSFDSVACSPEDYMTILFSSGTTGAPKAIPWNHTTPIKSASDGYYHHNIQHGDVVCWPTNLGWMMGPWLVFATLINKGTIALYYGAPLGEAFGAFVKNAKVNMLGVVPSLVTHWKASQCMEKWDWSDIKCFSSTGEVSNPDDMQYLMQLADNKPIIEYCGGTEIGGGYVTSTVVQPSVPSVFSTQALGGAFVLLDEKNEPSDKGEVYLIPPIMGLSTSLLNRNHHEVYYKNTPKYKNQLLRKHGDQMEKLGNGYYKAQGRSDDAMNLGGIKVSSIQIEEVVNSLDFVKESAAIAVSPAGGGPSRLVIYTVENALKGYRNKCGKEEKLKQVQQIIRKQINPLFKAHDLISLESLPRTASNKVMRRKLRDDYEA